MEQNLKKDEIDDYIQRDIPPSNSFQTNKATYCLFCVDILETHKAKEQLRQCKICNVKYSIKFCEIQKIASISQKYEHEHAMEDSYKNSNGLPQIVKDAIIRLLHTNPKLYPRQIRLYLNNNITQLGLQDVQFDINQVIGFVSREKAKMHPSDNRVEAVEKYLGDHLYFKTIDINRPFFFGFGVNDKNIPKIGNGDKTSRLYVFCTTLKLLQMNCDPMNQNGITLFHIDGTYKITKERYPMLVFGRSNPNRKMYPIVVGIISSEEQIDFEYFFSNIIGICRFFGINFSIRFLMQDAQLACSAAARTCFPGIHVLMCWFHLKKAVKNNITKSIESYKKTIEDDINRMHYTTSLDEFEKIKVEILMKWKSYPELENFVKYFTGQWLNSQWINWKLFTRPIGFSTTNNNTEGFN